MKLFLLLLSSILTFGQASRSSIPPRTATQTINYYISTGGSNSGYCTVSDKCLTLAHALSLIPSVLDNNYIINVADGAYAEGVDLSGFVGQAAIGGGFGNSLKILGNTGTPANVKFTGTVSCNVTAVACLLGTAPVTLSGIDLNATTTYGVWCANCSARLSDVKIEGTYTSGVVNETGVLELQNAVTISGFSTSFGMCVYTANRATTIQDVSGTVTCTGPGGGTTTALGIVCEFLSSYSMADSSDNLTITGVQYGILLSSESTFNNFENPAGTISITNATTPATSQGVSVTGASSFNVAAGNGGSGPAQLTVDKFTVCLEATTNAVVDHGAGNRSLTNCTASASSSGGTVLLF